MTNLTSIDRGRQRLDPSWWDHQRLPLTALRRSIESLLPRIHGSSSRRQSVLDFGCGDRPYESLLRSRGYEYIGADLEGDVEVRIEAGAPLNQPNQSIAGVVSFQVLEHVWDLDWYLTECRRILEPGGWLLLSTHGTWPYHPHPTDYRRWTRDGLRKELESRGLVVEDIRGLLGPLAWTTQIRALGLRHVLLGLPILKWIVPPLMACMNVRMVAEELVTPDSIRQDNACIYVVLCRVR